MIWIFHCLFDICSVRFFLRVFAVKRLKNKDIAFYASLNSDSGERRRLKRTEISLLSYEMGKVMTIHSFRHLKRRRLHLEVC